MRKASLLITILTLPLLIRAQAQDTIKVRRNDNIVVSCCGLSGTVSANIGDSCQLEAYKASNPQVKLPIISFTFVMAKKRGWAVFIPVKGNSLATNPEIIKCLQEREPGDLIIINTVVNDSGKNLDVAGPTIYSR